MYGPLLLRSSAGAEQRRGGRDATSSLVTTGSSLGITCVEGTECRNHHTTRLVMLLVLVYTGKDGKEQLQANMERVLQDIELSLIHI